MTYKEILFSTEGAIGILTLNSPHTLNALSKRMIGEMIDALRKFSTDETIKVVIIRALGKHFCAGHNLSEMVDAGVKEYKFIFDQCTEMMQLIHAIPQPVIAQVQGIATAAGCQLAAWCDLVIASEDAKFSTPGVKNRPLLHYAYGGCHQGYRAENGYGNAAYRAGFPSPGG